MGSHPMLFFFSSRRRHTRCLSDWSSDVCSSDLGSIDVEVPFHLGPIALAAITDEPVGGGIGRASCRGRGEVSVGAGSFKKKKRRQTNGPGMPTACFRATCKRNM